MLLPKRWFDPGAFVQSAEGNSAARPILQVVRIDKVRVCVNVSMAQVGMLDVGDPVVLKNIDGLEGMTFAGSISRMSAGIDQKSRMMEAEIDIDNRNRVLIPGYFGYVEITLVQSENQLLVPVSAITTSGTECVFILAGHKAMRKPVKTGESDGTQIAIVTGISEGDQVISNPGNIKDGQPVSNR